LREERDARDAVPVVVRRASPTAFEYRLDVHDGCPVNGFETPNEHAAFIDRSDADVMQPDRIRPVLRPGAEDPR
jgi:hypothetical protein